MEHVPPCPTFSTMLPIPWILNLNKASHGICQLMKLHKCSYEIRALDAMRGKRRFTFRGRVSLHKIFNFRPTLAKQGMYHDPGPDIAGQPLPLSRTLPVDLIARLVAVASAIPCGALIMHAIMGRECVSESRAINGPSTPLVDLCCSYLCSKYMNILLGRMDYHTRIVRAWRLTYTTCVARVSISTRAFTSACNQAMTECKQG